MSAENEENVGTPYILPTGDSLPELLAQLDTICDKLFDHWKDDAPKKVNIYGDVTADKRQTIGRIRNDIAHLIRIANIKDLRRKKAD